MGQRGLCASDETAHQQSNSSVVHLGLAASTAYLSIGATQRRPHTICTFFPNKGCHHQRSWHGSLRHELLQALEMRALPVLRGHLWKKKPGSHLSPGTKGFSSLVTIRCFGGLHRRIPQDPSQQGLE